MKIDCSEHDVTSKLRNLIIEFETAMIELGLSSEPNCHGMMLTESRQVELIIEKLPISLQDIVKDELFFSKDVTKSVLTNLLMKVSKTYKWPAMSEPKLRLERSNLDLARYESTREVDRRVNERVKFLSGNNNNIKKKTEHY